MLIQKTKTKQNKTINKQGWCVKIINSVPHYRWNIYVYTMLASRPRQMHIKFLSRVEVSVYKPMLKVDFNFKSFSIFFTP